MEWVRRASSSGISRKDSTATTPGKAGGAADNVRASTDALTPPTPMSPGITLPTLVGPRAASLPPPAVQSSVPSSASKRRAKKSARIDSGGAGGPQTLRVHWARFKKRIGTGTAPSSSSEVGDSAYTGGSSILGRNFRGGKEGEEDEKDGPVNEVVVDRSWFDEIKSSIVSQSEQDHTRDTAAGASAPNVGTNTTDHDSVTAHPEGFWAWNMITVMLRYRLWPATLDFFSLRFMDEQSENHYRKETWFLQKSLAIWSSLFLILNWALTAGTLPKPVTGPDRVYFYGVSSVLTIGVLPMVMWDWPRDRPVLYQIWLSVAIWSWMIFNLFTIYFCGFYTAKLDPHPYKIILNCGNKDFLGTFLFVTALPTIGLFGLKLKRFPLLIGALTFFIVGCVLILRWKSTWYRNLIQSLVFHLFLMFAHYARENAERRLHVLRDMLKMQYKATQKAQINERKAAESKRRLTSLNPDLPSQVRVPLNTALLAVQNMSALGVFSKSQDLEFNALEGSLAMMSKVLNDVLDFNRMDSGKFESVNKPYALHQVLRSLCVPLRMATDARKLELCIDLDNKIDMMARRAAYLAMGESEESIKRRLEDDPDEFGMVVGDEMRLRQIVNNLASNACKFTPAGGKVTITSRLIWPTRVPGEPPSEVARKGEEESDNDVASETAVTDGATAVLRGTHSSRRPSAEGSANGVNGTRKTTTTTSIGTAAAEKVDLEKEGDLRRNARSRALSPTIPHDALSADALDMHNATHERPMALEKIIVRIEVTDTGCGIQSHDMARNKLFSAFNQTEQGRQQGGKGTGLGLALVRQIVKRSGGRLGVYSAGTNQGSNFWVELPLAVGAKAIVGGVDRLKRLQTTDVHPVSNEIDTALADLTPPRTAVAGEDAASKPHVAPHIPEAQLGRIMDQRGRMVSLPSVPGEESNPVLERMAISDPLPSPDSDHQSLTESIANNIQALVPENQLVATEGPGSVAPPQAIGSARSEKPPAIQLPTTSPAAIMAMRNNQHTTMPHQTSPSASIITPPITPSVTPRVPAAGAATPWHAMPVLVVDDDSLTRMLMKRLLTRLGCRVTTAENGEVALELLTNSPRPTPASEDLPTTPDTRAVSEEGAMSSSSVHTWWSEESKYAVCFLDNQMPICSGLETVARMRRAGRKDFIVGVTGNALLSDQEEYLEAGADYVLTKPVLEKSLKGMLVIADERRKARLKPADGPKSSVTGI